MKKLVLVFGDKPGVVDAVRKLGFQPILVETTNVAGVDDYIPLSEKEAFSGHLDVAQFRSILKEPIAAILAANEDSLIMASELRERFFPHFKGLTRAQAIMVRDKPLMKEKLREIDINCARFTYLQPGTTWSELIAELGGEIIVKPRSQLNSRGMRVLRSARDFATWRDRIDSLEAYYAEQYLSGSTNHLCNTILCNGRVVVQFTASYPERGLLETNSGGEGFSTLYPSLLTPAQDRQMRDMALRFISSVGVRDGYCHAEFLLHNGRLEFGEMGVRLPGGWLLAAESFQCRTSIPELWVRIITDHDRVAEEQITVHDPYLGYYVVGKKLGTIRRISARDLPSWVVRSEILVKEGLHIHSENWERTRIAQSMFIADSSEQLLERSVLAAKFIDVEITPDSASGD